jgi:hypothetical protein
MVWTDEQVIEFLDFAEIEAPDLHPMFHLIAYRAPRRGEVCGLLASEVSRGKLAIVNQITTHGSRPVSKPPKSETGNREIFLDHGTKRPSAWPPAPHGPTLACSSPKPTAPPTTPTPSPNDSADSLPVPASHPSGCTICAIAPPASTSPLAPMSKSSRNYSATRPRR